MRALHSLLLAATTFAAAGCVSVKEARLLPGRPLVQQVKGPAVCGPVAFRRRPLEARWGEYVRVSVKAGAVLSGNAMVHAGGQVLEAQPFGPGAVASWVEARPFVLDGNAQGGAPVEAGAARQVVLEAYFSNADVERRSALAGMAPIDVTLSGLAVPAGASCDGAVFVVEHGALQPSVEERAWVAELERRAGPELAARRAAARAEAEARRLAHYAAWELRRKTVVSAEVVARADLLRQAHYAAYDARRAGLWLQFDVEPIPLEGAAAEWAAYEPGANGSASAQGTVVEQGTVVGSTTVVGGDVSAQSTVVEQGAVVSHTTVVGDGAFVGGGSVGAQSTVVEQGAVVSHTTVVGDGAFVGGGSVSAQSTVVEQGAVVSDTTVVGGGTLVGGGNVSAQSPVVEQGAAVSPTTVLAAGAAGATHDAAEWSLPADAQLRGEAHVWVASFPPVAPPPVAPACAGGCGADEDQVALDVFGSLLNLALGVAVNAQPQAPVIRAVPVGTR